MKRHGTITLGRRELVAKLAVVGIRTIMTLGQGHSVPIQRIAAFITECAKEFDLSNEEQVLFLKFVVCGKETVEEILKGAEEQ